MAVEPKISQFDIFFKVNISENTLPNDLKLHGSSIIVTVNASIKMLYCN